MITQSKGWVKVWVKLIINILKYLIIILKHYE